MSPFRIIIALVVAPVLAVVCAGIGFLASTGFVIADLAAHHLLGLKHGVVSYVIVTVTGYLPIVFGLGGLIAPFLTQEQIQSVFGTARWADTKELGSLRNRDRRGVLVGRDRGTKALLHYDGPSHLITMAPTRTGKGVGTIIPNLLTLERSIVCIDPKGENARITARARQSFGPVYVLDPFGVTGQASSCFNPFAHLDVDDPDIAEHAGALADALVHDEPGTSNDAHWNEEARALIAGLIMMVIASEPPDRRHPATLRDYLTRSSKDLDALFADMQNCAHCRGLIARAANRHLSKSDREASGVLSSAQRHTHFLDSPRMERVMQRSDFDFCDLKRAIQTVFLVLPPDRLSSYARWLRLMISQSLMEMARHQTIAPPSAGLPTTAKTETKTNTNINTKNSGSAALRSGLHANANAVLFLLDEFACLGRLAAVERAMGLMAGYGVQLWPILQDLHQLRSIYGKAANTFFANAGIVQIFGVNDIDTAELVARSVGKTDAHYMTRSFGEGKQTSSEHVAARNLINADEVMRLPRDMMILLRQGQRPARLRKIRYFEDKEFKGLFDPA
ncbi:type IV secretory system conjugative DNA transfer family protein [Agrobacterium larrymoorei]|uniref:Type IV secretory system conjugative DNA transfer family protein n=1 Tax=Agrobacterium larrymoorei TaxID=160699 RepID=A0ABX8T7J0_9HYPH|nr:type IV secretory system conjugative DNA transfer family protein [Agrobacterium larrymoorei]